MKDNVLLIVLTIVAIMFVYYILKKLSSIIRETFYFRANENVVKNCIVKIATTRKSLFGSTKSALEQCSKLNPNIEFVYSINNANRLLWKLYIGRVDIILLPKKHLKKVNKSFSSFLIPYRIDEKNKKQMSIDNQEKEEKRCYVVWNPSILSKNRDRVLFYIENEQCSIQSGYYEGVE